MPRIDPLKLLTCLSVLLAPNGGIKSSQEVKRLAGLMTKFSKKLVSKCIYIQILKCTETELLGQFMTTGGWTLTHMWLTDGILTKNWSLVQELLELLLLCPVDVMRLKSNSAPKLVKSLSKDSAHEGVRLLATKLVEQWLKIVKEESIGTAIAVTVEPPKPAPVEAAPSTVVVVETPAKTVVKKLPAAIKPIVMRREDLNEDEDDDEEEAEEDEPPAAVEAKASEPAPRQNQGVVVEEEPDSDEIDEEIFQKNQRLRKAAQLRTAAVTSNGKKVKQIARKATPNNTETLVYKFTVKDPKKVVVAKVDNAASPPAKKVTTNSIKAKQTIIVDSQNLRASEPEKETTTATTTSPPKIKIPRKSDAVAPAKESDAVTPPADASSVLNNNKIIVSKNKKDEATTAGATKPKPAVVTADKPEAAKVAKPKAAIVITAHKVVKEKEVEEKEKKVEKEGDKLSSTKEKEKDKDKERDRKSSSSTSSSSHHHHKSSSSKSSSSKSGSSSHRSSKSSSSSSSGDKDRSSKDKERSSKSSSSSSRDKEKEKKKSSDKESTSSLSDQKIADSESVSKIGKIPRKPSKDEPTESAKVKKPSISIERRQGDKPKTVKTLNSQFRSHGLTEEAPPPPARKGLKKPSSTPTPGAAIPSLKRASPDKDKESAPPEKKLKEDILAKSPEEKPGAIKLIKAKPQLMESDMFMDALSAASSKKDIRKRKRQLSKDDGPEKAASAVTGKTSGKKSPPHDEATTPTSPKVMAAPMKFYQDTLETSENDISATVKTETGDESSDKMNGNSEATTDNKVEGENKDKEDDEPAIDIQVDDLEKLESMKMTIDEVIEEKKGPGPGCGPDGPPGVLVIHRRKGAKKQVKWKSDDILVEIEYFVLDETERVNVTKNFVDARSSERLDERNAMQNRKLATEDLMEERIAWRPLIIVDNVPPLPEGSGSQEKKIQFERESRVLQSLYFSRSLVPDSAAEPDTETHPKTDPAVIPMDDVTGNPDAVNDFTNMAWPEPKGMAPNQQQHNNNNYQTNPGFADQSTGQQPGFPNPYDQQPQGNWMGQPPMTGMPSMGVPDPYHNPMLMVQPPNQPFNPQFPQMGVPPQQNFHPQNFQQPPNMGIPMPMNGPPPPMHMNTMGPGPMRGPSRGDHEGGGRGGWFRGGGGGGGGWNNGNNRDNVRSERNEWTRGSSNERRNERDYPRERGVCRQFQNTGYCRMGAKCNYIHVHDNRNQSRGGRY